MECVTPESTIIESIRPEDLPGDTEVWEKLHQVDSIVDLEKYSTETVDISIRGNPIYTILHKWKPVIDSRADEIKAVINEGPQQIADVVNEIRHRLRIHLCGAFHEPNGDNAACPHKNCSSCSHASDIAISRNYKKGDRLDLIETASRAMGENRNHWYIHGMAGVLDARGSHKRAQQLRDLATEIDDETFQQQKLAVDYLGRSCPDTSENNYNTATGALVTLGVDRKEANQMSPREAIRATLQFQKNKLGPKVQGILVRALRIWEEEFGLEPVSEDELAKDMKVKPVKKDRRPMAKLDKEWRKQKEKGWFKRERRRTMVKGLRKR